MSTGPRYPGRRAEGLIERFINFVRAETWADSRHILEEHLELLDEGALDALRSWVISIDDKEAAWWYEYHYGLLQACRAIGIASMFDHFIPSSGPPEGVVAPREFEDDLRRLAGLDAAVRHNPAVHRDRITIMERLLQRLDEEVRPSFRSTILINLGQAYAQLPTGDPVLNLQNAGACFAVAGRLFTPKTAPPEYAASQNSLGLSYMRLTIGERTSNLEKAIASFTEALRFRSPKYVPLDYAETENNLGRAYAMLPSGDKVGNLMRAIDCFRDALRVLSPKDAPGEYDALQSNLALATAQLERATRDATNRTPRKE